MKERPILFSGAMVRAILAGQKTQTRRVVKVGHLYSVENAHGASREEMRDRRNMPVQRLPNGVNVTPFCPYGQPGDRLWVRENGWQRPERTPKMLREGADTWAPYYFDADGISVDEAADFKAWGFKRRPSIHMPRWACRIVLEIVGVRVERLQDISEADARAEGLKGLSKDGNLIKYGIPDRDGLPGNDDDGWQWAAWEADPRRAFRRLWESINGAESWSANPWVWVIEFKRVNDGH